MRTDADSGTVGNVTGGCQRMLMQERAQPGPPRAAQPSLTPSVRRRSDAGPGSSAAAPEEELGALHLSTSCAPLS